MIDGRIRHVTKGSGTRADRTTPRGPAPERVVRRADAASGADGGAS
jgi:hypothetical protein